MPKAPSLCSVRYQRRRVRQGGASSPSSTRDGSHSMATVDTYDETAAPPEDDYEDEDAPTRTLKGVKDETGRDHPQLTDEEFEDAVTSLVSEAISFADDEVRPEQERGARYYWGECDLTSQKGRSKAVNRVVYEVISGIMP